MTRKADNGANGATVAESIREGFATARERLTSIEIDDLARKLVDQVETRIPDSSKRAIDDLIGRARRTREGIERRVDEGLDRTLGLLNIPTRSQIEALDRRLSDLTRRVGALQKARPAAKPTAARRRTASAAARA